MDALACKRQAMDLLASREHSRLELERKLKARAYADDVVVETLDSLEAAGLLDSARFVESFTQSRVRRGQGPLRIRRELAARGIDKLATRDLLPEEEIDWCALARRVRAKKYGASPPRDFKERARQARFLEYRGFEPEHIKSALDVGPDYD